MAEAEGSASRSGGLRQALPWIGIGVGLWAAIPPYVGPELANLKSTVEIVDHVIPSIAMVAAAVATLAVTRRPQGEANSTVPLVAGLTVVLAGLWMTATHLPLVNQARRGEAGVTGVAATWHTTPGVVVLVLGLVWVALTWSSAEDDAPPPAKGGTPTRSSASSKKR